MQIGVLARERKVNMAKRLCGYYAGLVPANSPPASPLLLDQVLKIIERAESYGLSTFDDFRIFLAFEASCGPEFELRSEQDWMRRVLEDRSITLPSRRLSRLVNLAAARASTARHNAALLAEFQSPRP